MTVVLRATLREAHVYFLALGSYFFSQVEMGRVYSTSRTLGVY